eukprot:3702970-Amphidinium_carterae.1
MSSISSAVLVGFCAPFLGDRLFGPLLPTPAGLATVAAEFTMTSPMRVFEDVTWVSPFNNLLNCLLNIIGGASFFRSLNHDPHSFRRQPRFPGHYPFGAPLSPELETKELLEHPNPSHNTRKPHLVLFRPNLAWCLIDKDRSSALTIIA